ncbi:MAG: ABC transporter substrate-binding protein [Acidobacteria bacterium]|nr:ABC transporter substrate-binding protein [Acidobacteriota bacterium]MBU1338251.1 ABC transporter substrate-binding protein [Acidobacteriota bacterium]MBU1475083.1 ABC transporter substrate-binding protein [Acidobacteriota bacterium]MBU2439052.1 ABC transporter substrate-binding protein [Acidobacteriota bacterium]MBU4254622.1 ABC transporter substrate-binding protein [Acidobacteriota bacterium]
MKKTWVLLLIGLAAVGCRRASEDLYTIGVCQVNDAPTLNAVREGFVKALEDRGFRDGENISLLFRNANGDIQVMQKIAREFVMEKVDMIVPLSTPSLQAALHATQTIPIVFSSIANPYLAGAGRSATDHLPTVTGVSSQGPIGESLDFIRRLLPDIQTLGTLWTPSELNSEYYLNLARDAARRNGLTIIAVPVRKTSEVLIAAQELVNRDIDVIYQISDNTTNASFEALSRVADENGIPLFGGFLLSTEEGAAAALGWDFFDMGYQAGQIALRVKAGESPGAIPIEYMSEVRLHLNLAAAARQGLTFPESIIEQADRVLRTDRRAASVSRLD